MLQVGFFAAGCLLLLGAAEASVTQQDPGEHTASVAAVHQLTLAFLEESSTDGAAPLDVRVPAHKLWRLNVPGSASNNLLHAVEKGQEQPWKQRLQVQDSLSCSETNASSGSGHTGCSSYDFVLHGCDAATFRSVATSVTTAPQSQHADYSHLHKRFIPAHVKPGQKIRTMTMVRDPFDHFVRSYDKKAKPAHDTEKRFLFAPTWSERGVSEVPEAEVPISEYAEKAFWRWNIFTRSLGGNFSGGHILNGKMKNDNITREIAEAINEEASSTDSSDLVNLAKQRLADMSFFGLFERLEDSMELLAHTMCWDFEGFEFQKQDRRHKRESPFLKTKPNGEPEDYDATVALIEASNRADRRLYEFASSLFEERVQQMREDKLNGIICRYIDTGCYVEDPHKSIAASVKKLNPVASKDEL